MTDEDRDELHIASLVVQHRAGAGAALRAMAKSATGVEIAIAGDSSSVLIQESPDTAGLVDCIERLRQLPGVLNVNLVYHHAEARRSLEQSIPHARAGSTP